MSLFSHMQKAAFLTTRLDCFLVLILKSCDIMDSFVPKFLNEKICNLLLDFLPTEALVVKTHQLSYV